MKQKTLLILFALATIVFLFGTGLYAQDIEVKASISSDKIGMDDMLVYTVTFKGINNPTPPDLSHFTDFRVTQTSRSTEFRFINGVSSYYTNIMFYLTPQKIGTFNLPPVTYPYNGKEYKTQSFRVEIVKEGAAPPSQRQKGLSSPFDTEDDFFSSSPFARQSQPEQIDITMTPSLSKRKVFKGEQIIFTVLLNTRNRVQGINMTSNQSIPGFWQEWFPMGQSIQGSPKNIDGKIYQVFEIRKAALFPTQSGTITIPSLKFDLSVVDSPISFFQQGTRTISRTTPEITIGISELPSQAAGLATGQFVFNVTPDKKQVDINDILSVKIKITGTGNIKTLNAPEFKTGDYYKVYPSKVTRDVSFNENSVSGELQSETPIGFNKTGLISFPSLEFSYFSPENSKVVTLKSQPFSITVTGIKEKQDDSSTLPAAEIIKKGEDIDFIKKGNIHNQDKVFYTNGVFTFLLLLPFIVSALFALKIYVFDRFISQSELLKKHKLINRTLKQLKNVKDRGEISLILEYYLKEKTGMGLSEINTHTIDQWLAKYGVGDSDINTFIRLKTGSESSRFSPGNSSANASDINLSSDIDMLVDILKRIDGRIK